MKTISKLHITFIILSLACISNFSFGQQIINSSIIHDDLEREYILYVPANYNPATAVPLLFNFHGYGSNNGQQMIYANFTQVADTAGFIFVLPLGTIDNTGNAHWNVGWGSSTVDDVGFTSALIDSISSEYNINLERVYSTGMSNGGFMSYYLACNLSDRIAGIASVTGSMSLGDFDICDSEHPMPILHIHGTADLTVPYNGNFMFETVEDIMDYWVNNNECETIPIITEMPDTDTDDGSTAIHYLYDNGEMGSEVQHYKIINGEHTWPGATINIGVTNMDINASVEVWKFLSRFDIHGEINSTGIRPITSIQKRISVYPNPSNSYINIERENSEVIEYEIFSLLGQSLISGVLNSKNEKIDISLLKTNAYYLKVGQETIRILKTK